MLKYSWCVILIEAWRPRRDNMRGGERMDWKEILTGDFLVNMLSVLAALYIWNKFLKNKV